MYATNRIGTSQKQGMHMTQLWASMRQDAHKGGARWLCAYEERWVETTPEHAESEIVFSSL